MKHKLIQVGDDVYRLTNAQLSAISKVIDSFPKTKYGYSDDQTMAVWVHVSENLSTYKKVGSLGLVFNS